MFDNATFELRAACPHGKFDTHTKDGMRCQEHSVYIVYEAHEIKEGSNDQPTMELKAVRL